MSNTWPECLNAVIKSHKMNVSCRVDIVWLGDGREVPPCREASWLEILIFFFTHPVMLQTKSKLVDPVLCTGLNTTDGKRQAIYQKFQYSINFCAYPFYLFEGQANPNKLSCLKKAAPGHRVFETTDINWSRLKQGFCSSFPCKNTLKINVSRAAIFVWWQLRHLTHKLTAMFCSVALHAIAITQPINKSEQRLLKFLTSSAVSWSEDILPQKLGCLCQSSKYSTCIHLVSLGR